jgi:hypothetical protein
MLKHPGSRRAAYHQDECQAKNGVISAVWLIIRGYLQPKLLSGTFPIGNLLVVQIKIRHLIIKGYL